MTEKKTKILKLTIDDWKNASRDKRELSVCRELGMEVTVMAKGNPEDRGRLDRVDGFDVIRISTRPFGDKFSIKLNRIASFFYFTYKARKFHPDIISGHDLTALMIGWLSTLFMRQKPKLVYDSHEFELGRAGSKRGRFKKWWIKQEERFLMRRCAFSIMVNDIIADTVQEIHGLKKRPIVVRNIPNLWDVNYTQCELRRKEMQNQMSSPREMMLMYHGAITNGRGVEMLFKLLSINDNLCLVVLGPCTVEYLDSLRKLSKSFGIDDRVLFHPAVHISELWQYVGAADIGMINIPAVAKSYYYMLPNKFFENIQSETPVICSNFPAIEPIVEQYSLGLTCDPLDVNAINNCVEKLRTDKDFYSICKKNAITAKRILCWEEEKKKLISAYSKLLVK